MTVIDRYFRTLRLFLPKNQRDDILRELSEEVQAQVADKEAALGRALDADEQAAIVRQYGHPLLTAARYRPQRHLIGPVVFPYFWIALKIALGLVVAGHAIGAVVLLGGGAPPAQLGQVLEHAVATTLKVAGWMTALGALAEFWLSRSRALDTWNPRAAPPARGLARKAVGHAFEGEPSVSGLVISVVVGAWWLAGLRFPSLFFGSGAAGLEWGPAMDRLYPVLVVAQLTMIAEQFLRLTRPDDTRVFRAARLVWLAAGWVLIYMVATSDHRWMVWHGDAAARANATIVTRLAGNDISLVEFVNGVWSIIFILVAVAGIWGSLRALLRRFRGTPTAPHVLTAVAFLSTLSMTIAAQAPSPAPTSQQALSDVEIRRILVDRVDTQHRSIGIVVGIVSPAGRRVVGHGVFGAGDSRPVTGETVFEIGSVTKVFTSWLLADMVRRGEVALADPVSRYLPHGLAVKSSDAGRTITLVDLATHTAGLPFWPSNVPATGDNAAALAGYTVEQLFEFISAFDVPPDVGTRWAYSNIDAGLLGVLLARRAGSTYDALLAGRITGPLTMTSTAVAVSPEMQARLASGHTAQLTAAARWNVPALAGGGSLHSSVDDLLTFLAALGDPGSAVAAAMPVMLGTRRQAPGFQQALGWMLLPSPSHDEILFHDGQTLGFASSISYDPATRTGVAVLSNTAAGVGDIARHVLRPSLPLSKPAAPAPRRTEIQIDLELFDLYAGQYEPGPGAVFTVSREGDALMLHLPGLPKLRLRPESEREFFVAENTRISVTFDVNATGLVTRLLLKAPTGDVPAARLERR